MGNIVLFIDGTSSTRVESFPTLSFQMATLPGVDNTLPGPTYLPVIDTDNSKVVGGDQDVILTMNGVPGVQYKVFAHSATFPDGSHIGRLSLSQVHADKVPMTPPNGTSPRLVGTLQPAGVSFNPPIQMTLPNTDDLKPGQAVEVFSFHHDVEQFVTEGTAHVSDDGSVIVTDPGFGLTVSGWHGAGGQQNMTTNVDGCGACGVAAVGICVPNPLAAGDACDPNDSCLVPGTGTCGLLGTCNGGTPKSVSNLTAGAEGGYGASAGEIQFFAIADSNNCTQVNYHWTFGDGTESDESRPSHQYTTPGSYTAHVTVKCDTCDSSVEADVPVHILNLKLIWSATHIVFYPDYPSKNEGLTVDLTPAQVQIITVAANAAFNAAFAPYPILVNATGNASNIADVVDGQYFDGTSNACGSTSFAGASTISSVYYEENMNQAQWALTSGSLSDQLLQAIGTGIGNNAAHEIGHHVMHPPKLDSQGRV